ncbi:hypothetical protein Mgra_00007056 [Meloidogyne graminicola]|uniref:Uncharacterized protein n=1 Tax=Meloidogyne graminicola TaxID=189291 RepID=A0A8S9ZJM4_9BILA|nr:hypothetical protein Mgra_00007056 [Meloidogyne graminicola]
MLLPIKMFLEIFKGVNINEKTTLTKMIDIEKISSTTIIFLNIKKWTEEKIVIIFILAANFMKKILKKYKKMDGETGKCWMCHVIGPLYESKYCEKHFLGTSQHIFISESSVDKLDLTKKVEVQLGVPSQYIQSSSSVVCYDQERESLLNRDDLKTPFAFQSYSQLGRKVVNQLEINKMTQPIVITWPQENVGHTLATSDIFHIQNTYNGWELYIDLNKFTPIGCQAVSTNIGVQLSGMRLIVRCEHLSHDNYGTATRNWSRCFELPEDVDPKTMTHNINERERVENELRAERARKKAEVRKRLEEAGRAKKAKKGFLTPERKKN